MEPAAVMRQYREESGGGAGKVSPDSNHRESSSLGKTGPEAYHDGEDPQPMACKSESN